MELHCLVKDAQNVDEIRPYHQKEKENDKEDQIVDEIRPYHQKEKENDEEDQIELQNEEKDQLHAKEPRRIEAEEENQEQDQHVGEQKELEKAGETELVKHYHSREVENERVALIAGVTGMVGVALAQVMVKEGWKVYGVARVPTQGACCLDDNVSQQIHFIACDLVDRKQTINKISRLHDVTHVFWVTWAAHPTYDCYEHYMENRRMFCNVLDALLPTAQNLKHIALQTGTKHYISAGRFPKEEEIPLVEDTKRVENSFNFYYALEDELFEAAKRGNLTWSVHRPGVIFGKSARSFYNTIGSLAVYACICKYLQLPLYFPGTRACYQEVYLDASDAELVARQELWAATEPSAANQAFNAVNGDSCSWCHLWPVLADKFGVELPDNQHVVDETLVLVEMMKEKACLWDEIVKKNDLKATKMQDLADWWLLDVMFRLPFKLLASTAKCREFSFCETRKTCESFSYWLDRMRLRKLIP